MTNDHISNLLTSLRNAEMASHSSVIVKDTKLSRSVLEVLKSKRYIADFVQKETGLEVLLIQPLTKHSFRRISKPSRRIYTDHKNIPTVRQGLGMVVLSTSEGVMAGNDARKRQLGGEIICEVY